MFCFGIPIDSAKLASAGNKYAIGVEYNCDPGDGTTRTFFVLEETTNSVSLLMNKNIDDETVSWCDQNGDNPSNTACNADGAYKKIPTNWTGVETTLPSYNQINNVAQLNGGTWPTWLYDYTIESSVHQTDIMGYWTSTPYEDDNAFVWSVDWGSFFDASVADSNYGVRPVITVSKNRMS